MKKRYRVTIAEKIIYHKEIEVEIEESEQHKLRDNKYVYEHGVVIDSDYHDTEGAEIISVRECVEE